MDASPHCTRVRVRRHRGQSFEELGPRNSRWRRCRGNVIPNESRALFSSQEQYAAGRSAAGITHDQARDSTPCGRRRRLIRYWRVTDTVRLSHEGVGPEVEQGVSRSELVSTDTRRRPARRPGCGSKRPAGGRGSGQEPAGRAGEGRPAWVPQDAWGAGGLASPGASVCVGSCSATVTPSPSRPPAPAP
jgi:hypothetical protein